jgi:glycosyltransferase involved in cell wall biosynthesis
MNPTLSVVIPAHNESAHLDGSIRTILREVDAIDPSCEVVVVDDGSTDQTWDVLRRLSQADSRVRAIRLSRRFGKEAAISAGLMQVRGMAVVVMDSDLQHPPALIRQMYAAWRDEGYDVVEAVTSNRDSRTWSADRGGRLFYALFRRMSRMELANATDFKLMDRRVVDAWAQMPERTTFFRGMSAWTGFRRRQVPMTVPTRAGGRSQWSSLQLTAYAIESITSFSAMPVYLIPLTGALFFVFGAALALQSLYYRLEGSGREGFPTVIIVQVVLGSVLLFSLGIIGQYIVKIYDEVKGRPRFIVAESTDAPVARHTPREASPQSRT